MPRRKTTDEEVSPALALADLLKALNAAAEQAHDVPASGAALRARLIEFDVDLACAVLTESKSGEPTQVKVVTNTADLSKVPSETLSRLSLKIALEPVRAMQQRSAGKTSS